MNRIKHHRSHIIKSTIAYLMATILLLWGWNSAIPDLFALPTMQFKQAMGLIILIGTVSFLLRCSRSHSRDKNVDLSHISPIISLKHNIVAQFKHPYGIMGYLAGFIMANRPSNIERNEWTLDLLELKPTDHLLEIGFGPGIAIEKASQIIIEGLIVGIDHSEAMLRQAKKRNAVAIQHGAVRLHLGSIETLPAFDRTFDKICSANVVQFWDDPVAVFKKLRALLTPSGVIVTTYMPRNSGARDADAYAKAREVVKQLEEAGFSSIRVEERKTQPVSTVSILAVNDVAQH